MKHIYIYLRGNFVALIKAWEMRWAQHKKYKELQRKEKALNKAKVLAEKRARMDGRRYYILPDWNGHYMVLNKEEIGKLKKAGVMSKRVKSFHLTQEAEYYTTTKAYKPKIK